jgi:phosphohistidine phosphatase SixA
MTHMRTLNNVIRGSIVAFAAMGVCGAVNAAPDGSSSAQLSGDALLNALRAGGYVIVMRHAHSPHEAPDAAHAKPGNRNLERQLDEAGRKSATAMGMALRKIQVPISRVLSSPAFRAIETARYLGLGAPHKFEQLGTAGMGASVADESTQWLRDKVAETPPPGSCELIITHMPNLVAAFGNQASDLQDGEALIFKPNGKTPVLVARVRIEQWSELVADWVPNTIERTAI